MTQAHRQSSGSTKLLVPEHAVPSILLLPPTFTQSTAVHFTLSANQRLYSFYSPNIYCINGNSPWLTSLPIPHPPKKAGKIYNYPLEPATRQLHISNICILWQIFSAIRPPSPSVWLPCAISILSKSPKNNHQGEGASAAVAAGRFQEIDVDIGLLPETRTVSVQDPSRDQGVVPGLTRGNEDLGQLIHKIMLWLQKKYIFIVLFSF